MHRMSGYDAQFIYDESPNEPQHTLKIAILGAGASRRYSLDRAKRGLRARLVDLPPMRWRAVRVPFDLHHPVWVEDPALDLAHHVRRLGIPAPGGRQELCEVISEIASTPLDPDRPLWEMYLLEGFTGGRMVCVLKMSHAVADGGASRELLERALAPEPTDAAAFAAGAPASVPAPAEPMPSRARLVRNALRDLARDLAFELPRLTRAALRARRRWKLDRVTTDHTQPDKATAFNGPQHHFGGPLSRRRSFFYATVSLPAARDVKSAFGVTLNDVLLATAAGGVRRYLADREALPSVPITGTMVASTRQESPGRRFGNRVTSRFLWLPTHLADPVERLLAAHDAASAAKHEIGLSAGAHLEDWLEHLPPLVVKLFSRALRIVTRITTVPGLVVVSNVPGPSKVLYAGDAAVESFISVGHMKFIAGLNITVWSYVDELNLAIYADARSLPDPGRLARHLEAAFDELVDAAQVKRAKAA